MKKTLQVENVKCAGCAATISKELLADFGQISVNLDVEPKQISLDVEDDQMQALAIKLKNLGYPLTANS